MKSDNAKKALVCLAIEQTLIKMGGITLLDKLSDILFKEYQTYMLDCYEQPEYLNKALKKLFGISHSIIVQSIRKELLYQQNQQPISDFLEKITE